MTDQQPPYWQSQDLRLATGLACRGERLELAVADKADVEFLEKQVT